MKIDYLLKDFEQYHSDFQIDNFIVGSQGGDWFKFKQCLREIKSRRESLTTMKEDLELSRLSKLRVFISKKKRQIFKEREKRQRRALRENIRETERELNRFVALAIKLKRKLGDINPDKRKALESAAWLGKARQMAAVEMLTQGGPSKQTIEFIISLPKNERRTILTELKSAKPEKILEIE